MPDQELCKNCLEPLCPRTTAGWENDKRLPRGIDDCPYNHSGGEHHNDFYGTPANDLCTRAKVVMVKGCSRCPMRTGGYCDGGQDNVRALRYSLYRQSNRRPGWCPFLDQKTGQSNAGIRLIAKLQAKEEPHGT